MASFRDAMHVDQEGSPSSVVLCLPVQCPGRAKEGKACAQPSSSTCAHVAGLAVAQKVPGSRVRGMYDAKLGAGDEQGEVWQVQNVVTPAVLMAMQEKPVTLALCSGSTLVKQLKPLLLELADWQN